MQPANLNYSETIPQQLLQIEVFSKDGRNIYLMSQSVLKTVSLFFAKLQFSEGLIQLHLRCKRIAFDTFINLAYEQEIEIDGRYFKDYLYLAHALGVPSFDHLISHTHLASPPFHPKALLDMAAEIYRETPSNEQTVARILAPVKMDLISQLTINNIPSDLEDWERVPMDRLKEVFFDELFFSQAVFAAEAWESMRGVRVDKLIFFHCKNLTEEMASIIGSMHVRELCFENCKLSHAFLSKLSEETGVKTLSLHFVKGISGCESVIAKMPIHTLVIEECDLNTKALKDSDEIFIA